MIPIYDTALLPCMFLPMTITHAAPKKYLGGQALTGKTTITCEIVCATDAEQAAVYSFWKNDLSFGLEPFLISMPLFGAVSVKPDYLVKFQGDFVSSKDGGIWKMSIKMQLFGVIDYVIDDLGNFIVSDTGDYIVDANGNYVPTATNINSYRTVIYAN